MSPKYLFSTLFFSPFLLVQGRRGSGWLTGGKAAPHPRATQYGSLIAPQPNKRDCTKTLHENAISFEIKYLICNRIFVFYLTLTLKKQNPKLKTKSYNQ